LSMLPFFNLVLFYRGAEIEGIAALTGSTLHSSGSTAKDMAKLLVDIRYTSLKGTLQIPEQRANNLTGVRIRRSRIISQWTRRG
jgi:hypothetical protein